MLRLRGDVKRLWMRHEEDPSIVDEGLKLQILDVCFTFAFVL
ncbi:unnamed protein product [marine sediment metagenome]|uniref:Uncharacterized protein n=1 Tax=marine sediment metagenome TaxID=412755 RepID=X0WUP9_9ZZZZ